MSRPSGARNHDFRQKRQALIDRLTEYVLREGVELPSFRQMAEAAKISESTLRHYFSNRSGVIVALLENIHERMQGMEQAIGRPEQTGAVAIKEYLALVEGYMKTPWVYRAYAFGMREGFSSQMARKAFLETMVQPFIKAASDRIKLSEGGPSDDDEAETAGTLLLSTALYIVVHQFVLNGREHAPMDIENYLDRVGGG